jgi:DNA-binding PadR family transcriptional regulator
MHGYELRKQLHARLGSLRAFSWGSVYPTLRRLQRAELIVERDPESTTVRGSWGRRGRRVYEITAEGKDRLDELLGEAGPRPSTTRASACTWPSSPGRRPRCGCASSRAGDVASRSGGTVSGPR